ncbi:MAG: hypothetical protein ACLR23_00170 [Clostridia bacterium]
MHHVAIYFKWVCRRGSRPELDTQIRVMKSLEISYIEMRGVSRKNLCDYSLAQAQEIKAQLDEAGVKISAIGSP